MRIVVLTSEAPPNNCGIADHSALLADELSRSGHKASILACNGYSAEGVEIIDNWWKVGSHIELMKRLEVLTPELLIVQFTPLMYKISNVVDLREMVATLKRLRRYFRIVLIVHESYFIKLQFPVSWIRGFWQKKILKEISCNVDYIFSASVHLLEFINTCKGCATARWLPISSNFYVDNVQDRELLRRELGINSKDILVVLFGGGNSLRWYASYVQNTDILLCKMGIPIKWLFLGGVSPKWFSLRAPVISPGFLPSKKISQWLTASDLFLMPHWSGVSAKRGTLFAALQHGLPVVGTQSKDTDNFLTKIDGIRLINSGPKKFAQEVLNLSLDRQLMKDLGMSNKKHFQENFTWPIVANSLISMVSE